MSQVDPRLDAAERTEPLGVLPAGTALRGYEVVSVLGQGSFGITYLARDATLGREVAIKEYLPSSLAIRQSNSVVMPRSTEFAEDFIWGRDRFLDEARTLARLDGVPAVVRVIDFLEANGTAYTVMALVRGETLERLIGQKGRFSSPAINRILWPLLDGLEQVHGAGFLHRDIKPGNIILDAKGQPTLIDFGASREAMAGRTMATMTAIFTPGYAAAEQFASAKQGPWTDIYGLSATLYHAIAGVRPPSAFERTLEDAYRPLTGLALPGFDQNLLDGIDAGMTVRAADRPQSIAAWREVFRQKSTPRGDTIVVRRPEPPAIEAAPAVPAAGWRRLSAWMGIAAAIVLLAVGGYVGKSMLFDTAVHDLTVQELAKALEERRKADVAAAERKKLEEEAQRQAALDAEAKRKAREVLAAAQLERQKAEQELAKFRAEAEARRRADEEQRQQAAAAARRAIEEAARKSKAEAEMAALRQAEEDASKKAAAEAEAKRQADDVLARAQAERQRADEVADRQRAAFEERRKADAAAVERKKLQEEVQRQAVVDAEAKKEAEETLAAARRERQKTEEELARLKAETDARRKADEAQRRQAEAAAQKALDEKARADSPAETDAIAEKKAAESAEGALQLSLTDRQHLQVALTSLGFDTRGTDGVFGPRTRSMIAAWQKARNEPATGFFTSAEDRALLQAAATAIGNYDADQKKIEEARKKAEEEARNKLQAPASPGVPRSDSSASLSAYDGRYSGALNWSSMQVGHLVVQVRNGGGTGVMSITGVGFLNVPGPINLIISPDGFVRGVADITDGTGKAQRIALAGNADGSHITLTLNGRGGKTVTLSKSLGP